MKKQRIMTDLNSVTFSAAKPPEFARSQEFYSSHFTSLFIHTLHKWENVCTSGLNNYDMNCMVHEQLLPDLGQRDPGVCLSSRHMLVPSFISCQIWKNNRKEAQWNDHRVIWSSLQAWMHGGSICPIRWWLGQAQSMKKIKILFEFLSWTYTFQWNFYEIL